MPDPIIADTPFGETPAWPPSPARLDRELDAQNNKIVNVDWTGDPINLSTDVTGRLGYANLPAMSGKGLLGRDAAGDVTLITIGSNVSLTGNTLSAATTGGAGLGDFSTNTSTSVANELVLFADTTGKLGKRSTGTGVAKLTSGVLSVTQITGNTDISGVIASSNMPALTGDVSTPGGSLTTTIGAGKVTNAMLAGGITGSNLVGTDITTVGTITSGQWASTPIPVAYGGTGSTSIAAARAALGIETITSKGDTNYSILSSDRTVSTSAALTAPRTWTLPQASTVNDGSVIKINDAVGGVSTTNYVQIAPFAGDTINGSTNNFLLNKAYGMVTVTKVSSTNWVVLATTSIVRRVFTSNQTYTTPVGIKAIYVECVGGGGAGGGAAVASSNLSLGAGGGGGGYASVYISSPSSSYLITIGAGGSNASGAPGGAGGNTTFGAVCAAGGGQGGNVLAAGTSLATIQGNTSGTGTVGDLKMYGGFGGAGIRLSASVGVSGFGGAGAFGFGSGGITVTATSDGGAGTPYGGGGAGGLTTGAAAFGGAGYQGVCLVTEYY